MYKKLLSCFLLIMLLGTITLSACSKSSDNKTSDSAEYTDEQREEYIKDNMVGDGKILTKDDVKDKLSPTTAETNSDTYSDAPEKMYTVASNANFDLYLSFDDTTFVVTDKRGQDKMNYYSAASKLNMFGSSDTTTFGVVDYLSNLTIEAYDSANKKYEFTSYKDSVESGSFYIVKLADNKIRLIYTIGNDDDKQLVPTVLTEETYNKIIATLQQKADDTGEGSYKTNISDLQTMYKELDPDSLSLEDQEKYASYYPVVTMRKLFVTRTLTMKQKSLIRSAMQAADFTVDDLKTEMNTVEYAGPARSVLYTIPLDIELDEDGVSFSVDTSLILAPNKQKLYKISLVHSFGAAKSSKTSGEYMILPDGSGTYIESAGTMGIDTYRSRIYGSDLTFDPNISTGKTEQLLSSFFVYNRALKGGFISILESGQGHTFIRAQSAGRGNTYSCATSNFEIVYIERDFRSYTKASTTNATKKAPAGSSSSTNNSSSSSSSSSDSSSSDSNSDKVKQGDSTSGSTQGAGVITSKTHINEVVTAHYIIDELSEDNVKKTYSDYAKQYREYLQQKNMLPTERVKQTELPFYAELLGAADKTVTKLGFPVVTTASLTSYSDIKNIADELYDAGIDPDSLIVKYDYWSNGGYYNILNDKVRTVGVLGSADDLKETANYLASKGTSFYPEANFMFVYRTSSSLDYTNDAARRIDSSVARVNLRDFASGKYVKTSDTYKTVLTPAMLNKTGKSFESSYSSVLGFNQIALQGIGKYLNSSYKNNDVYTRIDATKENVDLLSFYKDSGYDIMTEGGNDYTWAYSTHILDVPTGSSEFMCTTRSIPFIQLVLHGYVNYATTALNESGDYRIALLTLLETGSGVHFKWMAADNNVFVDSALNNMYSLNYNDSLSYAVDIYKTASEILKGVENKEIIDHHMLDAYIRSSYIGDYNEDSTDFVRENTTGVYMTTYETGLQVVVNYNCYDAELDDEDRTVVPAYSYIYRAGGNEAWQVR